MTDDYAPTSFRIANSTGWCRICGRLLDDRRSFVCPGACLPATAQPQGIPTPTKWQRLMSKVRP